MDRIGGPNQQITGVVGGQIVPVTDTPLLTSASTKWSGFLLEIHAPHVVRQDVFWGWNRTHINLYIAGSLSFRVRRSGRDERFVAQAGSALVFPSGFDETRFDIAESDFQLICVELDPTRVDAFLGPKRLLVAEALAPQMVIHDGHIAALLSTMASEVSQGCPGGALYGQSLSLALAAYLTSRFSVKRLPNRQSLQFSEPQIRLLMDYIHANLDCEVSLFDLANLVQLRPRQFFRKFSNTFGTTPHQFIMNERVARAKELLSRGQLLADIAARLGFASQSHFSAVFRKVTGIPPGRFRREFRS